MMPYRIEIMKPARRFIENQLRPQQERLLRAINKLPYEGDILPLSGRKNEYRLRVGDYRVIYSLYDDVVTVVVMTVGNRGDIYK